MEENIKQLSAILESFDKNPREISRDLEELSCTPGLLAYLISNLNSNNSVRIVRQLLQHTQESVLGEIISNKDLPAMLIECIASSQITYDNIWVFSELYDESTYLEYIKSEVLERLVDALDQCPEDACANLVKVLLLISEARLEEMVMLKNSSYFGEMLIYRLNWASGTERKKLLETVLRIIREHPRFFYINDLKVISDITIRFLQDGEMDVIEPSFSALVALLSIDEFFEIRYRFDVIADILEISYDKQEILSLKQQVFSKLNQ